MLFYKTAEEIQILKESCKLIAQTLTIVKNSIVDGAKLISINKIANNFINDNKNKTAAVINNNRFDNIITLRLNGTLVQDTLWKYELQPKDLVSIDCSIINNGLYANCTYSYFCNRNNVFEKKYLEPQKQVMQKVVSIIREGNRTGDIGYTILSEAKKQKLKLQSNIVSYGIGKNNCELPIIKSKSLPRTGIPLKSGMVLLLKPVLNFRNRHMIMVDDGCSLKTNSDYKIPCFQQIVIVEKFGRNCYSCFELLEKN